MAEAQEFHQEARHRWDDVWSALEQNLAAIQE